jgi:hypothetical protein
MSPVKKPSTVAGLRRGLSTGPQAEPESVARATDPADVVPPPRPEKPVRFTLDLDQERHAFLKAFALECGTGVGGAQVMRALLDELREGAGLPMRVRARIWAAKR